MKKLLTRWFPSFFHMCNHMWVDHTKYEGHKDSLKILVINPEGQDIPDVLGISFERQAFLEREVKKILIDVKDYDRIKCITKVAKLAKHINEFYCCVRIMEIEIEKQNSPMGGLIAHILKNGPQRPPEGSEE